MTLFSLLPLAWSLEAPDELSTTLDFPVEYRIPHFAAEEELADALSQSQYRRATQLLQERERQRPLEDAEQAALLWCLVQQGRVKEALPYRASLSLDLLPQDQKYWAQAQIFLKQDQQSSALDALEQIEEYSPWFTSSVATRARLLAQMGRKDESVILYESLVARDDRDQARAEALLALAARQGYDSERSADYLRQVWADYPDSSTAKKAEQLLRTHYKPALTWQAAGRKAQRLMERGKYQSAVNLLETWKSTPKTAEPSKDSCRYWYVYGRSQYKKNGITLASQILGDWGQRCAGVEEELGPKMLYLTGRSLVRLKRYQEAGEAYVRIADLYPASSYADDGLLKGAIALFEAGDPEQSMRLWERQAREYPDGDMIAEGLWRLAWHSYLDQKSQQALKWAHQLRDLPPDLDPQHILAGHYWSARWALYPDVRDPSLQAGDIHGLEQALEGWKQLALDHSHSYYGLLAAARLYELDPEIVERMVRPGLEETDLPWQVRQSFLDDPLVRGGLRLWQLGFRQEASQRWARLDRDQMLASEVSSLTALEWEENWLRAHDGLHRYILYRGDLGAQQLKVLYLAHPLRYWTELQDATEDYDYEPRIFHALVREESLFNAEAKSWAGARGLAQLMPATARSVGGRMGLSVSTAQLTQKPELNLKIGAYYFNMLMDRFQQNPFLSLAGYNAGEGNVERWLKSKGNLPLDEFVEHIPFQETRHYVKRVMGTYQSYHLLYGEGPVYQDYSRYLEQVLPDPR